MFIYLLHFNNKNKIIYLINLGLINYFISVNTLLK